MTKKTNLFSENKDTSNRHTPPPLPVFDRSSLELLLDCSLLLFPISGWELEEYSDFSTHQGPCGEGSEWVMTGSGEALTGTWVCRGRSRPPRKVGTGCMWSIPVFDGSAYNAVWGYKLQHSVLWLLADSGKPREQGTQLANCPQLSSATPTLSSPPRFWSCGPGQFSQITSLHCSLLYIFIWLVNKILNS